MIMGLLSRLTHTLGDEKNSGYVYDAGPDWSSPEAEAWIDAQMERSFKEAREDHGGRS